MTIDTRRSPDSRSYFLYFFALITISSTSGLVYGWPALRRNLLSHGNSALSEKDLGAIFTCGAWSTQAVRLFIGLARDKYGTKIITCLSLFVLAMGCLGIAFSGSDNVVALGASMVFVGVGSGGHLCMQAVAGLFPYPGVVLTSLSGAFQVSGFVFVALFLLTTDRSLAFGAYFGVCLVLCVTAAIVLPWGTSFQKIAAEEKAHSEEITEAEERELEAGSTKSEDTELQPVEEPDLRERERKADSPKVVYDLEEGAECSSFQKIATEKNCSDKAEEPEERELEAGSTKSKYTELQPVGESDPKERERKADPPKVIDNLEKPVRSIMRSSEYIGLLFWFSVCVIVHQYYVGSIGFQLEQKGDANGAYAVLFSAFYSGAALLSPFVGYLVDCHGLGVAQGVATSLTAISMFILASDSMPLSSGQSIGLLCYGFARMMVWGSFYSNIGKRFGYKNYGTLAGFGLIVSAMASLLQYPLIAATADGHGKISNVLCGTATLVTLPYCYWLSSLERRSDS